jgi:tetratricopeptide (TPR) repeat protein
MEPAQNRHGDDSMPLGQAVRGQRRRDRVRQGYRDAAGRGGARSKPGADASELAATLYELANANFYAGHLDVSESLNQRTLTMHRELYGNAHPLVTEDLINLVAIQYERGRYVDAENFYRRALDINQTWYGKTAIP